MTSAPLQISRKGLYDLVWAERPDTLAELAPHICHAVELLEASGWRI
jgi:hypothetical protein